MKIAVIGAGAMGSLFGGLLAEAKHEVWLHDLNRMHMDAVNKAGLIIEKEDKTRITRPHAAANLHDIGKVGLVIVFVKSTHTAAAAKSAKVLRADDGFVMTLQNGMGNADAIAEVIPAVYILAGATAHGATFLAPGRIRHAGSGLTSMGVWDRSQVGYEHAQRLARFFTEAGIETTAMHDVRPIIWDKLLVNVGINAVTALCAIKNGKLPDLPVTRNLCRTAITEAVSVAEASGVNTRRDAVEHVFQVARATAANRSSMGQDVDHRRQTEISAINGYIVKQAHALNLHVPVNETLSALVETLQYHYRSN